MTRHVRRNPQTRGSSASKPRAAFRVAGGALLGAVALTSLSSVTGCAQSVGDIDRTQPDLVSKEHFQGRWFIRETIVHVPSTSPASFEGEPGNLEEIVWDIQQDHLIGYRAYEFVPGVDSEANSDLGGASTLPVTPGFGDGRNPAIYKGEPIVAYPIQAHVDVQRGYNARTGEQTNVISENTSDRPWFERQFMRVDWATNAVDSLFNRPRPFWSMFGASQSLASFVPQNEGGANVPHMEFDEDTGLATYMDFTVRSTIAPTLGGCIAMLETSLGDCTGQELLTRTSMLKVDPERERDYVPLVYGERRQGEFGYFRVERPTWDRHLGNTFSGLIQLADRHEMWANSRDASGEPLPYSARTLRPIRYTLSENYPEEMLDVTEEIAAEYDESFKRIAEAARGQTREQLMADLREDTDGGTCLFCLDLNLDNSARNGDLRYNFIYWVHDPMAVGPLGFGPSSAHPETGRIVSASAYVYGAAVDQYAETSKQMVELMIPENQGGLSEEELMDRSYFINAARGGLKPVDPRAAERFRGLSGDDLAREVLGDAGFERFAELSDYGTDALAPALPGFDQARLQRVVGEPLIEAAMVPEEWVIEEERGGRSFLKRHAQAARAVAQELGEEPPVQGPLGHLTVTNWYNGGVLDQMDEIRRMAERKNLWLADFDDPALAGLAKEVAESGLQGEDLYQMLRKRIYRAVMLHELGHTLGLRHNFAGSADPLNYHPQYWDERIKTIEPVAQYMRAETPVADVFLYSNCSVEGPLRTVDGTEVPGTNTAPGCAEQRDARMAEYQYSSIMDYGGRFNADFQGLGRYDHAALASGYGDLVEVFDDEVMDAMAQAGETFGVDVRQAALDAAQVRNPILYQGLDVAMMYQGRNGAMRSHYTNFPDLLGGHENIGKRHYVPREEYNALLDASNQLPPAERARVPVKVPYMSCYDEYVDSVDNCHRWDHGADHYEIVANNIQAYKEYYVFNNFQRDRIGFDSFGVYRRIRSRYFLPLTNMYQHWFWGAAITRLAPLGTPRGDLGLFATTEGLNTLLNTLSTPDYGPHRFSPETGMYEPVSANGACQEGEADIPIPMLNDQSQFVEMPPCVSVPRGVGRSYFSRYDSSGYDVFRRILEAGHFYDSMAALDALSASNATIVGVGQDVQADSRTFRIPLNLVFQDELTNLFSSIYSEDDPAYALHVVRPANGVGTVLERSVFNGMSSDELSTLPIIRPGRTYTTRVQALVAGMNMMDGSLNSVFARQGQISLTGSGEQRAAPDGFETVEVADPLTGRSFVAYRTVDRSGGPWYAADLLEEAKRIVEDPESSEPLIADVFGDVELVRLAYSIWGD